MKFKYPGFDLALFTALPAIFVMAMFPYLIISGNPIEWYMWLLIPYGLSAILIWFQLRAAGIVFICFNALGLLMCSILLLSGQLTLRLICKGAMNFYSITAAYEWLTKLNDGPHQQIDLENN